MPRSNPYYQGRVLVDVKVPRIRVNNDPAHIPVNVRLDFRRELENLAPRLPATVGELRDALRRELGSNRAVARDLGVTPRTLERYIATEEHRASQKRGQNVALRTALVERMQHLLSPLWRGNVYQQLRERGAAVTGDMVLSWSDEQSWRFIRGHIAPAFWPKIIAQMERGHWNKAADLTARAFLEGYDAGSASLEMTRDLTILID